MRLQCPRGARDLWGAELATARFVISKMRELFERFGFQEVQTPIFEHLELFLIKSGSEIVRQIYDFEDKSGRKLALRPELTAPAIRFFIQHLKRSPPPVRLFYFGECFRYEEPQAWRWRQFTQGGCEIIGCPNPQADAEVISLTCEAVREIGLSGWELRIGDVGVLRRALSAAGVSEEKQDPILRAVDSRDRERILRELEGAGVPEEEQERLVKLFSLRGGPEVLQKLHSFGFSGRTTENFEELIKILKGVGEKFEIDLGIARGLDYYTGPVFEVYAENVQIAGGGRYDTLVERLGGPSTPATGVGFGIDRISSLLLRSGKGVEPRKPLACVIALERDLLPKALEISNRLRRSGVAAEMEIMERSLQKALSYANSAGVRFAIIIGRKESSTGLVTLHDMKTGKQESVRPEELLSAIKSVA